MVHHVHEVAARVQRQVVAGALDNLHRRRGHERGRIDPAHRPLAEI
jgi:hypothetical protein